MSDPERPVPPDDVPPVSAEELVDGEAAPDAGEPVGDPEVRRYPSTLGGACYLVILAVAVVGLVLVVTTDWRLGIRVVAVGIWIVVDGSWRLGIRVMGGALLGAALVRLVLRSRDAGMLAVRNKWVDALLLIALGGALIFLAGSIPDQPGA